MINGLKEAKDIVKDLKLGETFLQLPVLAELHEHKVHFRKPSNLVF